MKAFFQLRVRDFDQFCSALDQIVSSQDCSSVTVYHNPANPRDVLLLVSDLDPDQFDQFYRSPQFAEYAAQVGLIDEPQWAFMDEVRTLTPAHH